MGKNKRKSRSSSSSSSSSDDEVEFWRRKFKKMERKMKRMMSVQEKKRVKVVEEEGCFSDQELSEYENVDSVEAEGSTKEPLDPSPQLDDEIKKVIGEVEKTEEKGVMLSSYLVPVWTELFSQGLSEATREKLIKNYPPFCNVLMAAPLINPEVLAAVPETAVKKDKRIQDAQNQIAACLSALGLALSSLFAEGRNLKVIHQISEGCKLLIDLHVQDSSLRKTLMATVLDTDLRKIILESNSDKYLFGSNFTERIKESKILQKSAAEIKKRETKNMKGGGAPKARFKTHPTRPQFQGRTSNFPIQRKRYPQHPQPPRRPTQKGPPRTFPNSR